jgi:chromosomal replication initiator protein
MNAKWNLSFVRGWLLYSAPQKISGFSAKGFMRRLRKEKQRGARWHSIRVWRGVFIRAIAGKLLMMALYERIRRNGMHAAVKKMTAVEPVAASPESVKMAIAARMDSDAFQSWIAPLKITVCDKIVSLIAPNQFSVDFIKSVYLNILESAASDFGLGLHIGAGYRAQPIARGANDNESKTFVPSAPIASKHAAFDAFIASEENAFVLSACKKLAGGGALFSPLFIYGPSGCGKSLLAGCISSEACGRTLMMTGGQFVSEFLRAMREHSVFAFKDFCRNCDTFILDDVHVLAGKRATMDEFLQLILDLRASGRHIVLTANAAPGNLGGFDRRMQSLLASGLVADIAAPNKNVKKAMLARADVSLEVAEMLSGRIGADGHLVAGVAKKINAYAELMGEKITIDIAERLLADTLQKNKTPLSMVKTMCDKLGVSYDEVCGSGRARMLVRARQIMMSALKSATKLSLTEIGRLVGDRDHATVLYALAQIEKARASDLILSAEISQMIEECR